MLKLHHPDGWSVAENEHHILREKTLLRPPCFKAPLGIGSEDQSPFIENGFKA